MVVLSFPELGERGIRFTRQHLHRLIRAGKFPAPIKIGENTNAWVEPEIDQYMKDRIAARDAIRQQTPEKKKAR
jgi:prophage regulatory protein